MESDEAAPRTPKPWPTLISEWSNTVTTVVKTCRSGGACAYNTKLAYSNVACYRQEPAHHTKHSTCSQVRSTHNAAGVDHLSDQELAACCALCTVLPMPPSKCQHASPPDCPHRCR